MNYHYLPIYVIVSLLACSYYLGYTPPAISLVFVVASIMAYLAYARDKAAARNNEWRVPENSLHLYALLCGWPGAIIAQQKLRHKTRKTRFRLVFWLTLVINMAMFSWFHTQAGSRILHRQTYQLENRIINELGVTNATRALLFLTTFRTKAQAPAYGR